MSLGDEAGGNFSAEFSEFLAAEEATRAAAAAAEDWLELFRRTARETVSRSDLDRLLNDALVAIAGIVDADAVALMLANDDASALVSSASCGHERTVLPELLVPAGSGLSGRVLATGQPLLVADVAVVFEEDNPLRVRGARSYAGVAMRAAGRTLGVLHATRRRVEPFVEDDLKKLELFAGPLASAIERVALFQAERRAREAAEKALAAAEVATQRLRSLQRITAALASASSVSEVCELILGEAVREFTGGLGEGAIWMLQDERLILVAGSARSARYRELPLDASLPAGANMEKGAPLFVESRAEVSRRWPALSEVDIPAFAGLPLIVEGRRLGLMAIGYREAHTFPPDEREYLAVLAEQAASALSRAEAEMALFEARRVADERRDQLAYLAEASERLGQSLDLDVTLSSVVQLSVPRLADRCAVYLLEERGLIRRSPAPDLSTDECRVLEHSASSADSLVADVVHTGQVLHQEDVDAAVPVATIPDPDRLALLRRTGLGGILIVPLRARGRIFGALALVNQSGRPMSDTDRALGEELGARAALAIDNAMLYGREAHIASRLTESLLPARLPSIEGIDLAVRYEPGSQGLDIGGDFYDVFPAGERGWWIFVGDVQGKGVEAAAVTGLARHTLKSAAMNEISPAELMAHLNAALVHHIRESADDMAHPWDSARLCTAVLLRLERVDIGWSVTVTCAGHPPPLLRRPGSHVEALCDPALLLGVDETMSYSETEAELTPGACIVCYTDGASDRLTDNDRPGEDVIAELFAPMTGRAEQITEAIATAALARSTPEDDLVVLTLRVLTPDEFVDTRA